MSKKEAQPEIVTTYVTKVSRVYIVPTTQGMTIDLDVELACGGFVVLTGFTNFNDKRPVQVLKSDIRYGDIKEEEVECSKEE